MIIRLFLINDNFVNWIDEQIDGNKYKIDRERKIVIQKEIDGYSRQINRQKVRQTEIYNRYIARFIGI